MDAGWNTFSFPFGAKGLFSGALAISFREGMNCEFVELYIPKKFSNRKLESGLEDVSPASNMAIYFGYINQSNFKG